jgi:uncharacterized protein
VELERKYKKPNQRIENDLQTNGSLLDNAWGVFLKKHGFLVGLSIDGPKELHDRYRVSKDGKPTFDKVYAAAQMLHLHGVPFNVLSVVNRVNANRPLDVYRFLKNEIRPREMQFIPCVEPKDFKHTAPQKWDPAALPMQDSPAAHPGNPDSVVTDWSVDPDDWGYFLCKVWDDWAHRDIGKVFVNHFETAVAQWKGMDSQLCIYHEFCGKGVALEHDGNLYSCDHYVYPEYKLGNILETSSSRMFFFRSATKVWVRQVQFASPSMRRMQFPFRLQWRMPQKSPDSYAGRRAWAELPLQRTAQVLAAHRSRRERHLPASGEG